MQTEQRPSTACQPASAVFPRKAPACCAECRDHIHRSMQQFHLSQVTTSQPRQGLKAEYINTMVNVYASLPLVATLVLAHHGAPLLGAAASISSTLSSTGRSLAHGIEDELIMNAGDFDPAAPQRTTMQCLGTQTLTRACHFENVYYDLKTTRFVHFGTADAEPHAFGDDIDFKDPWLRLTRCVDCRSFVLALVSRLPPLAAARSLNKILLHRPQNMSACTWLLGIYQVITTTHAASYGLDVLSSSHRTAVVCSLRRPQSAQRCTVYQYCT